LGIPFAGSSAPFTGYFQPHNPLAAFAGVPLDGEWILTITNHKPGDDGVLEGWSLIISQSTTVDVDDSPDEIPDGFVLYQNFPDPFNPSTTIRFSIPNMNDATSAGARGGLVVLKVYDVLGREVATLVEEALPAGEYELTFDAGKARRASITSGVYFYQLKSGGYVQRKKMVLIK